MNPVTPTDSNPSSAGYGFSSGELEWARQNLPLLRRMTSGNTIPYYTLAMIFVVGLVLYGLAYVFKQDLWALPWPAVSLLLGDLLHNLGIMLWTAVVLALLLEVMTAYQRKHMQRYLRLVETVLGGQSKALPSQPQALPAQPAPPAPAAAAYAAPVLPAGSTTPEARLDLLLARIDRLQREVEALHYNRGESRSEERSGRSEERSSHSDERSSRNDVRPVTSSARPARSETRPASSPRPARSEARPANNSSRSGRSENRPASTGFSGRSETRPPIVSEPAPNFDFPSESSDDEPAIPGSGVSSSSGSRRGSRGGSRGSRGGRGRGGSGQSKNRSGSQDSGSNQPGS